MRLRTRTLNFQFYHICKTMKNSFLFDLAQSIISSNIAFEDTVVVLPNRRAQRLLLKTLAEQFGKAMFAPAIYSIDEFMDMLSPLQKMSKLEQLVQLFLQYKTMKKEATADFNEMLAWAPSFLKDISEIDMQMDDGVTILKDLASAKEFEIPFGQDTISAGQQDKIAFFQMLSDLYVQYRNNLSLQHLGYDGLIYRDCAEHVSEYAQKLVHKHYVFAGFHVLSPSEIAVIKYIQEHFDTQFYFDVDPFYCDFNKDARFSTAHFLNKICKNLSLSQDRISFNTSHFASKQKNIQIVGTAQYMNQIYYAIDCLEKIKQQQGNLDDTALVLADESLLLPFLTAYDVTDANVTMGYPIKATPAYTLLETILETYQTCLRYMTGSSGKIFYHYSNILSIFRNPFVKKYLFKSTQDFNNTINGMESSQHSPLYHPDDFATGLLPSFSPDSKSVLQDIIHYIKSIVDKVVDIQEASMLNIVLNTLLQTEQILEPMGATVPLSFSTVRFAIHQQLDTLTLPIQGDATKGLQVMGLLETRTLDFKNVILLSVNEGVLPAGISFNSLIPFDFKFTGETLENYLYKDQVYAYHFFRLLQRAENIVLMYDNDCSNSLMEKSRFITQLEFEIREQGLDNIKLEYPNVTFPFKMSKPESISVHKTPDILKAVENFEFSASALNVYINCPLQFYLNSICRIQQPDTFKEKIGSNLVGSIAHAIFENVFNDIKENPEDAQSILNAAIESIDSRIRRLLIEDEVFRKNNHLQFGEDDLKHGRFYLAVQMVRNDVINYLTKAKEEMKGDVTIIGNELKLYCTLAVGDENKKLTLKGSIDRLQKEDGHLTVIDYKTGKVDESKLKVALDSLGTVFSDAHHGQFIQLVFYALLCRFAQHEKLKGLGQLDATHCAIISIKDANQNRPYLHKALIGKTLSNKKLVNPSPSFENEFLDKLETSLKDVLAEIINPQKDFSQTNDSNRCINCDFKHICKR